MTDKYKDIIDLPHHTSPIRHPMSLHDRAAQFAPFAALDGLNEAMDKAGELHISTVSDRNLPEE